MNAFSCHGLFKFDYCTIILYTGQAYHAHYMATPYYDYLISLRGVNTFACEQFLLHLFYKYQ